MHYPAFALEVRTPRLTLRVPTDEDLVDLAELAERGVHDPDASPFSVQWTAIDPPHQQRNTLAFFWQQRPTLITDAWHLTLVAVVDGAIAGTQSLFTRQWPVLKTFETGSWLGREFQGRGLGTDMRAAVLHLGFEGFGAERAVTAAWDDNPSSLGVTRALGYRPNGTARESRNGEVATMCHFVLDRADWETHRRDDIEIVGADAVAACFGTVQTPRTD